MATQNTHITLMEEVFIQDVLMSTIHISQDGTVSITMKIRNHLKLDMRRKKRIMQEIEDWKRLHGAMTESIQGERTCSSLR